ncbi:hypothetical protein [Providencia vermicola]|uniref:hypothetical protein n=1 Tax=Providencia vermicola TaxID=333965 RepID=UPI001CECAB1A|nr:hypothetical protein [Providencia vermicola]
MKIQANNPINEPTLKNTAISKNHLQDRIKTATKHVEFSAPKTVKNIVDISAESQKKIDKFIKQLQSKETDKDFFSTIFSTLTRLKKNEKENFIAGTVQTLKSLPSDSLPSLYDKFTKGLNRYMAINLMNQPFTEQLNRNLSHFNVDGNDDDDWD